MMTLEAACTALAAAMSFGGKSFRLDSGRWKINVDDNETRLSAIKERRPREINGSEGNE